MADIKFSELPAATAAGDTDVLAGVQGSVTKKFSLSVILAWLKTRITASDVGAQPAITANGILKGDGAGGVSAATPGTDYGTYSKPSGGIPASDLASGVVPSASTANPAMDGTAAPGSSTAWARGDHVHPSDTSKVPTTREINGHALSSDVSLDANDVPYDNTGSGLSATNVQDAIDELAQGGWSTCEYSIVSSRLSDVSGTVQRLGNMIMVALYGTAAEALTMSSEILRIPCVVSASGFRIVLCANNNFVGARANAGTGSLTGTARLYPNGNVDSGANVTITGLIPIT